MAEKGSSHPHASIFSLPLRPRVSNENEKMAATPKTASAMNMSSPGISVEFHGDPRAELNLPPVRSAPPDIQKFQSPLRHHKRTPSAHYEVKETLNARSEYTGEDPDGSSNHRINQYVIKDEIGRGSYGAVHLAVDQFGHEFAVKEFSKARLRKRAQSNILRHGPKRIGRFPGRAGFGAPDAPSSHLSEHKAREDNDALFLIREEIAIMKKMNHPNLVRLIEVLDDPEEDSLYMVLEMCKKGVIMKVGLNETAAPYPKEETRTWFRDLILGIEYLHSQGVVHRDIKPDNLLLTDDGVLKIVDFGVSEMFEKPDNMRTSKSAGSPAFQPPELCVAKHGHVSGKAADIWSMGVSLYCLYYGRLPFERDNVLDMYEAIKTETPPLPAGEDPLFVDLMSRLLEKDPEKRITMAELREHAWVTKGGQDPLLSAEENCSDPVEPPNALEVNHAFTRRMSHLFCVMKAIRKFKGLLAAKEEIVQPSQPTPQPYSDGNLPSFVQTSSSSQLEAKPTQPSPSDNKAPPHPGPQNDSIDDQVARIIRERQEFLKSTTIPGPKPAQQTPKGQALDPLETKAPHLGIGTGAVDDFATHQPPADFVSDSPTAAEFNIYDRAFDAEVERIKRTSSRRGAGGRGGRGDVKGGTTPATLYHTKLNRETSHGQRVDENVKWADEEGGQRQGQRLADLVAKVFQDSRGANTRENGKEEAI